MQMHMQRWLLEFPATMRKAAQAQDHAGACVCMTALEQHYSNKTADERLAIYRSLAHTILEDLDRDSYLQYEGFLQEVGLLFRQRA